MRAIRLARTVAFLVALGSTAGALAQPTTRSKRNVVLMAGRPNGAVATAYMSGKQPLVGGHAPSVQPVKYDGTGRQMLSLTTINHGESLAIPAARDEGGFASVDLD